MERVYIDKPLLDRVRNVMKRMAYEQLDGTAEIVFEIEKTLPDALWIPVESQIPENDSICLVAGRRGALRVARAYVPAATGHWQGDPNEVFWTVVGSGRVIEATHWMPLPEPPSKSKNHPF